MKTTKEELESMAIDHASQVDEPEMASWHGRYSSYKRGFKACEAKMLKEASKDFEEFEKYAIEVYCSQEYGKPLEVVMLSRGGKKEIFLILNLLQKSFEVGRLSQAKKDAERIKKLEAVLVATLDHVVLATNYFNREEESRELNIKINHELEFANSLLCSTREALKQGGEK